MTPRTGGLLLLALSSTLACSEDKKPTEPTGPRPVLASATIDASGGSITTGMNGITVMVPPGALPGPTDIVLRQAASAPAGALGGAVDLEPDGTMFAIPVSLTFEFPASALPPDAIADDVQTVTNVAGSWESVPGRVVQSGGTIRVTSPLAHFSTYAAITVDATSYLYGTFGFDVDDVYAYGAGSILAHFDGNALTTADIGAGVSARLFDGWARDATTHYIAGWDGAGRVWRQSGSQWLLEPLPAPPVSATSEPLVAIAGDDAVVAAVGHGGRIVVHDGTAWTDHSVTTPGGPDNVVRRLRGVAALGGGELVVVGDDILLSGTATSLAETDLTPLFGGNPFSLQGVWGRAPNDVYAVGLELDVSAAQNVAVFLAFDGSSWSREPLPPNLTGLRGVAGDADDVVTVGNNGTILRRSGAGAWAAQLLCDQTARTLYDCWAVDPAFTVAVGSGGLFLHPGATCAGDTTNTGQLDGTIVADTLGITTCDQQIIVNDGDGDIWLDVVDGTCGLPCSVDTSNGLRIQPGRFRAIGDFTRVEVDVVNVSGSVTLSAWFAGVSLDSDTFSGTGAHTLVVSVPSSSFYLAEVDGCDFRIVEMRYDRPTGPPKRQEN